MPSFNKVIIMGNLTRDVEVRYTPGGTAVTEVGVAINRRVKNKQTDEWEDKVTFVDVTLWARTAEVAAEYLSKGAPIHIEGRLELDQWEDRETGLRKQRLKVVAEGMQLIGQKGNSSNSSNSGGGGGGGIQPQESAEAFGSDLSNLPMVADDEVPF